MFGAAGGQTALAERVFPITFAHAYLLSLAVRTQIFGLDENSPLGRTGEIADPLHRAVVLSQWCI